MFNYVKNRQQIKEKLKYLNANKKALKEHQRQKYIKNGEAYLDVYLKDETLFEPFSNPINPRIREDVYDYLIQDLARIPVGAPLNVNFHIFNDDNYNNVSPIFHEHFWEELATVKTRLKKTRFISVLLFSLGIILYMIYFTFIYFLERQLIFKEVISITATFLIWESVDYFLLQGLES